MKRAADALVAEVPELASPAEVAAVLRVRPQTVIGWFRAGVIPAEVATGKIFRFSLPRVRQALAQDAERQRQEGSRGGARVPVI